MANNVVREQQLQSVASAFHSFTVNAIETHQLADVNPDTITFSKPVIFNGAVTYNSTLVLSTSASTVDGAIWLEDDQ